MEQREKKEREKEEKRERKNSIKAEKKERQKREKQEKMKKKKDKGQALPDGFQCGGQSQNFGAPNGQEGDGGHLIGECICGFFADF